MTIQLKRILLPTDFSEYSKTATKYACELAKKFDAELHLLHTLEIHPTSTPEFGLGLALPSYYHESKAAAEKSISKFLDPNWETGRKVIRCVLEGSPKTEIIKYAREHDCSATIRSPL